MIDPKDYEEIDDITGVSRRLIEIHHTEEEQDNFWSWMSGQTCVVGPHNQLMYYSWDYERWLEQGMKAKQGKDWD